MTDASAMVEVLLRLPGAESVEARMFRPGVTLHAPHLLDVEVAQVVRRLVTTGKIDHREGRDAINDLADMPIKRYPHDVLLKRIWALRGNLSAYDAAYVALAEALDAPLLTRDRRLANAAGLYASIQVV